MSRQFTTGMDSPHPRAITDLIFGGTEIQPRRDDSDENGLYDDGNYETEVGMSQGTRHANNNRVTRESAYVELFHSE